MMNITRPPLATVLSLAGRQAPALFVFSFLVNLLSLISAVYMLRVLEQARRLMLGRVSTWLHSELGGPLVQGMQVRLAGWTPSGPNWRPRGHRHRHSSPQAGSKQAWLSISPR
jgi:hypothetical protein